MLKCLNFGFFSCVLYCKKRCFLILVLLRTFKSEQNVDLFAFISLLSNILHNIRKDTNCYVLPLFSNLLNLFLTVLNIPLLEKYPLSEFSDLYFPAFGLNTERHGESIQSKYGKIRTPKTTNTDSFHAVFFA